MGGSLPLGLSEISAWFSILFLEGFQVLPMVFSICRACLSHHLRVWALLYNRDQACPRRHLLQADPGRWRDFHPSKLSSRLPVSWTPCPVLTTHFSLRWPLVTLGLCHLVPSLAARVPLSSCPVSLEKGESSLLAQTELLAAPSDGGPLP